MKMLWILPVLGLSIIGSAAHADFVCDTFSNGRMFRAIGFDENQTAQTVEYECDHAFFIDVGQCRANVRCSFEGGHGPGPFPGPGPQPGPHGPGPGPMPGPHGPGPGGPGGPGHGPGPHHWGEEDAS